MRRYAVGATSLLLLAALTACEDDQPRVEEPAAATTGPSYAVGRIIHRSGDASIASPDGVAAFVETRDGAVWATRDGRVWFGDGEEMQQIGATREYYLEADHEGSLAAWIEFPTDGPAELVVWDTALREEVLRTDDGTTADMRQQVNYYSELEPWGSRDKRPIAFVYVVEGRSVYWLNTDGAVRTDVDDGRTEVLEPDADEQTIRSVENGVMLSEYFDEDQPDSSYPTWIGGELFEGIAIEAGRYVSDLSPDGTYVVVHGEGRPQVIATADGTVVRKFRPRNLEAYSWTDDDTFQAMGLVYGADKQRIFECEVTTGACRVTAEVPRRGGRVWVVLPADIF